MPSVDLFVAITLSLDINQSLLKISLQSMVLKEKQPEKKSEPKLLIFFIFY